MITKKIIKTFFMLNIILIFNSVYLVAQSTLFYSVPYFETHTINPIYGSYYIEGVQANELMYSRLWTWKKDISETSDLVEGISNEKSLGTMLVPPMGEIRMWSYKIKMREGLKWPDGKPLTAEDVKYSFEVYKSDRTGSALKELLTIFKNIKVLDHRTIQFFIGAKDRNKAKYVLPLVQILPKHKILTNYLLKNSEFAIEPMGSGPFQFVSQEKRKFSDKGDDKIVFNRNEHYYRWGNNSNIGSVKINVERVVSTVITKLINPNRSEDWKTLDLVLNVPNSQSNFKNLKSKGDHLSFEPYSSNSWYAIALNCEKPFFQNRNIRKALTHALDIEKLITKCYTTTEKGGVNELIAHRISGPFNPLWGFGDGSLQPIVQNLDSAMFFLDGENVTVEDKIRKYNEEAIKLKLIYNSGRILQGSPEELIIEGIVRDLKKIGININTVSLGARAFENKLVSGDYDMAFQYYEIGYGGNIAPLFTRGDKLNISRFSDPMLTSYLDKFNSTKGNQKANYGKKIHQLIYKEAPYIFLYRLDKILAYRKEDIETHNNIVPKYFFTHIAEWYFKD